MSTRKNKQILTYIEKVFNKIIKIKLNKNKKRILRMYALITWLVTPG